MKATRLIALDWGTSNLRASLLDETGHALQTRSAACGVMAVRDRDFESALTGLCGDWLGEQDCAVMASGMIGSRQGWQEVPYLGCPASLEQAADAMCELPLACGLRLHIAPGLRCEGAHGMVDVMRGEETQVWGAAPAAGQRVLLPGTHSKWVWMGEWGRIERFRTFMTGELYALHRDHGIIGRLMGGTADSGSPQAFARGARLGLKGHGLAHHLVFSARTAALTGGLAPEEVADYLSGLLIGIEVGQALLATADAPDRAEILLIGEEALCERYQEVLTLAGVGSRRAPAETTQRGQWRIAQTAGLLRAGDGAFAAPGGAA